MVEDDSSSSSSSSDFGDDENLDEEVNVDEDNNDPAGSDTENREEDEEGDDEDTDLFGNNNEDYMKTIAVSVFLPPTLQPASCPRNQDFEMLVAGVDRQNGVIRGLRGKEEEAVQKWEGMGLDPYFLGTNYRVLADLQAGMEGPVSWRILQESCIDLIEGFDNFIEKKEDGAGSAFSDLLACLRNKQVPLDNIHFVTYRNNLNKILATAYNRQDVCEMEVHIWQGTVYLNVHKLPEAPHLHVISGVVIGIFF